MNTLKYLLFLFILPLHLQASDLKNIVIQNNGATTTITIPNSTVSNTRNLTVTQQPTSSIIIQQQGQAQNRPITLGDILCCPIQVAFCIPIALCARTYVCLDSCLDHCCQKACIKCCGPK